MFEHPGRTYRRPSSNLIGMCLGCAALVVAGCDSPQRQVTRAKEPVVRDMPDVLRGTIGSEATFRGIEPQLVSGFGIVVGLAGTGAGTLDPAVQATMERELARGGVGLAANNEQIQVSPAKFLRDPNVAVVIVEAAIPPGAPKGMTFDVRVRALDNSGITSLEGGQLWTTELRIGPATVFTGFKTKQLAIARGPIFLNPFAEPGKPGQDGMVRTVGRVLGGGLVTDPLKIELMLDNESWARSRSITAAINTRFPPGPGDDGPTARGRDKDSIALRVPAMYRDKPGEFLTLLRHTRIDQSQQQEFAKRYVEEMKKQPELAPDIAWCLRAIGKPAVPFLAPMYDYPEFTPRMAALEAGAALDDPKAVPALRELASSGPPGFRARAIKLMGDMRGSPKISLALREMVNAPELDVRVAAYEALAARMDPTIDRVAVGDDPLRPKFYLDTVPANDPMIYVTQQGQPRIVLFGGAPGREPLKLTKPLIVSAWSDRLMLTAENERTPIRLMYRDTRTNTLVQQQVPDSAAQFVQFLAHKPTPEDPAPGLNFTYSEVVGALYEVHHQKGIPAVFAREQDRLQAEVILAANATRVEDRPETADAARAPDKPVVYLPNKPTQPEIDAAQTPATGGKRPSLVVPLNQPKGKN